MEPYCKKNITSDEINLLLKIKEILEKLPTYLLDKNNQKIIISCHVLTRAFGDIFNLKVIDGYFF